MADMLCCTCNTPTSGAHLCKICQKPCHAIEPCAISCGEEGFGTNVICSDCFLDIEDVEEVSKNNEDKFFEQELTVLLTVLSTGHEKTHITVMLTARTDGFKLRPFILLPRKRPIPEIEKRFKNKLILVWCGRNWMDDELTSKYL
ncbi:hypothetical protein ACQ4LE_003841 [Meloidogyne hapla]